MDAPLRIAHVMGCMNGGGVEQMVINYHRHIDRSRVQFDYLVCEGSTLVPREEIESLGGRVFMLPAYSNVFGYQSAILSLFKEMKWQIVHSHLNSLSFFPLRAAKKAGIPIRIAHSHSTSGKGELAKNAIKTVLRTQSNRYPTHRFANSEYAGKWLFGDKETFEIIYNAVELDKFYFNRDIRAKVRKQLGVDSSFVVGHVGRFVNQKNQAYLLKVFSRVIERRPDCTLVFVGDGEQRQSVQQLAADLGVDGNVLFLGRRSDIHQLYNAFDVFALPSLYEGLCLVGVEAQASGLPCVFSEEIPSEIKLGNNCQFLPLDDPGVWVDAILGSSELSGRDVNRENFRAFDITAQSKVLVDRYLGLLDAEMQSILA